MDNSLIGVLQAFFTLLRSGIIPIYEEVIAPNQADYLKILTAAFAGSGSAGVVVIYFWDKIRQIPLLFCRDHVIICGLHEITTPLVRQLKAKKIKTIVIGSDNRSPEAQSLRNYGTIVLSGDPKDPSTLALARITRARTLLALTDSDGINAEIALSAGKLVKKTRSEPLNCILQIHNPGLWRIIREHALLPRQNKPMRIDFYNPPALSARILLGRFFSPHTGEWTSNPPLLVVVGLGKLGENITARAAREWFDKRQSNEKLRMILIDLEASSLKERLVATYPRLEDAASITAVSIDIQSAEFQKAGFIDLERLPSSPTIAFVCLKDDTAGLSAALTLSHHLKGADTRIFVRMDNNPSLASLLGKKVMGETGIIPFNSLTVSSECGMVLGGIRETLARAIHEHYVTARLSDDPLLDDPALVPWERLSRRLKESNRSQAASIVEKLHAIGCDICPMTDWSAACFSFTPGEVEYLAEQEHIRWVKEMDTQGFSFGSIKDERAKTHPSMIAYESLSEAEKEKDRETVRMIPYYLSLIDFQVYRPGQGGDSLLSSGYAAS
ncbi:hypothetical protein J2741_002009 [Methanolinea mesophila]|uniref:RyR domain-containing protein n=1 Tax=Methanolinea mesophila TaxID=547055 RepID=UPI001AE8BE8C|nr:RyR domain-containing protein [Methanolinea mesophila]MBP1929462.1 hypothetical protein [Methanolinea mesophila]